MTLSEKVAQLENELRELRHELAQRDKDEMHDMQRPLILVGEAIGRNPDMTQNQKVILPLIRRVMPNIIAQQIIGTQPMSDSAGTIFGMRANWGGRVVLTKEHYRHFLRVYNRRKHHHPDYLTGLGYPHIRISIGDVIAAERWCRVTFKKGSYVRSLPDFWFANERDAMLFSLRWA